MVNPIVPHPHKLLTPIQNLFLQVFKRLPDHEQFYLTGGTALAEYYLGHRLSYDLDFFTGEEGLVQPVSFQLEKLVENHRLGLTVIRRFSTYVEFLITYENETLRVDLALDSPFRFQPPVLSPPGILINNYIDLCVDKLLAYYGRAEPRDAVDLYFIMNNETPDALLEKAKQKDPGFDKYWFAIALNRCVNFPDEPDRWPLKMLADWDPKRIKQSFNAWAIELMDGL